LEAVAIAADHAGETQFQFVKYRRLRTGASSPLQR
jgi:hypothetical protein